MNINRQKKLAADYGFNLCAEYRGNNGARVIPHTISERSFDGQILVSYRAKHKAMDSGKWAEGDCTLSTMHNWIFA